jgi:hypothetical protein
MTTFEDLEVWRRGCQLAVDVCVATGDSRDYALKDQMPVLREIYENPLENTGRDQSKKRRKSKKNRTTRVNNESAIYNSGAQSKSQIPGFIENYQRKNETPMRSGSKMTTI